MKEHKMKTSFTRRFVFLSIIAIFCSMIAIAQTGHDDVDDNGTEQVPIDGGISLLVAAGIGYGVKKVRDERRKNNEKREVEKE